MHNKTTTMINYSTIFNGKWKVFCAILALICGNCAFGMDYNEKELYENSGENTESRSNENPTLMNRLKKRANQLKQKLRFRRNTANYSQLKDKETTPSYTQTRNAQTQTHQDRYNTSSKFTENRKRSFQNVNYEQDNTNNRAEKDPFVFVGNRLYHYEKTPFSNTRERFATPTTVDEVVANWNDISEIRYANDVLYDKLENPKVTLFRNNDDSCYIILQIAKNTYDVFFGINERNVEMGENSFSVYEVSDEVGSFTDNIDRLIYVDKTGLYFVPAEGNSVEDIIDSYQKGGEFKFEGPVIKVSTIDGSITLDGKPITKDNFFDNWVWEEREIKQTAFGITETRKVKDKIVISTRKPTSNEILRNFYPPKGNYEGMYKYYIIKVYSSLHGQQKMSCNDMVLSTYDGKIRFTVTDGFNNTSSGSKSLSHKEWLNTFINKRLQGSEKISQERCEKLVHDGTFASILSTYADLYPQKVQGAILDQVNQRKDYKISVGTRGNYKTIAGLVISEKYLFLDPEFVKSLKPAFAEIEKDYENNKESDAWIVINIVKHL